MDNRWYGIIIILIVGIGCMYLIASSSNTIASAVVIVDDISVTLPHNFIIGPQDTKHVVFKNSNNNESIELKYISDGNNSLKEFNKEVKLLENSSNIEIKNKNSNGAIKNITCTDNSSNTSYMLSYFDLYDRTLLIKSSGYSNIQNQKDAVNNLISTIQPDFKQNRD